MKAILPGATANGRLVCCGDRIETPPVSWCGACASSSVGRNVCHYAGGQPVQNSVLPNPKCFRIKVKDAPVAQLDRASAF